MNARGGWRWPVLAAYNRGVCTERRSRAIQGGTNRLLVEGTPYRLDGTTTLTRTFTFSGKTYTVSTPITSHAEINEAFFGYQYDVLSRSGGHVGIQVGAAYFNASGTVSNPTTGSASDSITIGLPLLGAEGRVFLVPNRVNINGQVKGMSFGSYGKYVETEFNLGVSPLKYLTIQASYRFVDIDIHESTGSRVVNPRFSGPVFSIQLRG